MVVDKTLWKLILVLQRYRLGKCVAKMLYASSLVAIYNFFILEYEKKNPTLQMKQSRNFFMEQTENKKRVKKCIQLLNDDISREIYKDMILFRITHDYHKRPVYNRKDQYFPQDIITLKENEVFIDCGAYNGDTIEMFLKAAQNKYKKIIAFEPDKNNMKSLEKAARRVTVINAVVWDHDTKIAFAEGDGSSSRVIENVSFHQGKTCFVQAKAIDNVEECVDASFIKMDIEGSEYQALQGAYNVISKNKPTLAICIYHSDEDMLRIMELIHSWNLGYKFYVRHHAQKISETVLYAKQ